MSARRDEPVPLKDALTTVGRDLGLPDPDTLANALAAWPDLVGDALAAHTSVRSLRDGVLTIAVDSPAFATQLHYLADDLAARAAQRLGAGLVESVRVVVDRPA